MIPGEYQRVRSHTISKSKQSKILPIPNNVGCCERNTPICLKIYYDQHQKINCRFGKLRCWCGVCGWFSCQLMETFLFLWKSISFNSLWYIICGIWWLTPKGISVLKLLNSLIRSVFFPFFRSINRVWRLPVLLSGSL